MSIIKGFGKATVQGILAVGIIAATVALALMKEIDGPSFLGLAIVVAGFYFRSPNAEAK